MDKKIGTDIVAKFYLVYLEHGADSFDIRSIIQAKTKINFVLCLFGRISVEEV
jgi:hypothetical protein